MNLVLIRDDATIGIDGIFYQVTMSAVPDSVHAVQWSGSSGVVEYKSAPAQAIESLKNIPWIFNVIKLFNDEQKKKAKEIEAEKRQLSLKADYDAMASKLEKDIAAADAVSVSTIIDRQWINLTLAERRRGDVLIGIDVTNAIGLETQTGTKTLFEIRRLFKACGDLNVRVFSDVLPRQIDRTRYCSFLQKLGATITHHEYMSHMSFGGGHV